MYEIFEYDCLFVVMLHLKKLICNFLYVWMILEVKELDILSLKGNLFQVKQQEIDNKLNDKMKKKFLSEV